MERRGDLGSRISSPEPLAKRDLGFNRFLEFEDLREGRDHEKTGIGHEILVIESCLDAFETSR